MWKQHIKNGNKNICKDKCVMKCFEQCQSTASLKGWGLHLPISQALISFFIYLQTPTQTSKWICKT
jgi:hypothetical protein